MNVFTARALTREVVGVLSAGFPDTSFATALASVSDGDLLLADASFSDATTPIVSAAVETYQGVQIDWQNSATAIVNSMPDAALWVWPFGETLNLTDRPSIATILERVNSVYPALISLVAGFVDNGNARATTGNGWGVEFGWSSGTVRRVAYLARAGAGWSRTVGAGVDGTHFGADVHVRPHTHTDIAQGRAYPRDSVGRRSSVPGVNVQGSTVQLEGRMTHFFIGGYWNSVAGATPRTTADFSYWIGEETLAS